jgi:hypothetical protein
MRLKNRIIYADSLSMYPRSPNEAVGGMLYFGRMLDKIRLHANGKLGTEYHAKLGHAEAADGTCCNFFARELR